MNRTLCDVLEAMRKCYETRNFSYLPGLIEEAQLYGDRMEGGLTDKSNYEYYRNDRKKLQKEVKELEQRKVELEIEVNTLEKKVDKE